MSVLIKNATILTNDSRTGIVHGAVLIEDEWIKAVIPYPTDGDVPAMPQAEEVVDAGQMILIPGLINAHYHSYANLLKGTRIDLPLEIWSLYTVAYGHSLDDEEIRLAVLLGAAEMMKNGITSCLDHFPHLPRAESALRAYEQSGMRVVFAPMMHDVPDHRFLPVALPEHLSERLDSKPIWSVSRMRPYYLDLIDRWHGKQGRIDIAIGPNAPQRCSKEMLQLCRELRDEANLQVHTHLLESSMQDMTRRRAHPRGVVGYLDEAGLLTKKLSVAHAVWLHQDEIRLLHERGVTVVHNPASNLVLGSGKAPVIDCLEQGVSVSLGTDASNCGGPHNLFEAMRLAVMLHRLGEPDYRRWPQAADVWRMATSEAAKALGMEGKLGAITAGAKADLVLLKTGNPPQTQQIDIVAPLVFHEDGRSVDSVMINGKWTVRGGTVVTFDEQAIIWKASERLSRMEDRCQKELALAGELTPQFERMYRNFLGLG
jgi:5-methylthioadenosine/S-adenosylhomocysteine deaminase